MTSRAFHVAYRPLLMSVLAFAYMPALRAPAQVDHFPDIPTGSQRAAFETVSDVNAAMDLQEFPDGSGRLLTNRILNRLYIIQPSGSNSIFLQAGRKEDFIPNSNQGSTSVSIHPSFADVNSPGYAKFYTLTNDTMPTEPPDFASPGLEPSFQVLLTEWTMDDIRSDVFSGSSRVVMRVELKSDTHHYMNDLAFGPDGNLYISIGENLNRDLAISTDNIFGKILRIDPFGNDSANGQYGIPTDNPFISDPGSVGEIFAYGLRNPWRIWFDRVSGELYTGDVGWNTIEEVNRIVGGGNYGWPTKEGSFLTARQAIPDLPDPVTGLTKAEELGLTEPLFEYDHTDGQSVIGGLVYRGSDLPWLDGKVIFGDWETWLLMAGDPETGEFFKLPFTQDEVRNALGGQRFNSINEDLQGEIYLVGGDEILRLTPLPGDVNLDGMVGVGDIDLLYASLGSADSRYDLDNNGDVDTGDVDELVLNILNTWYGDANLDGTVNATDLNALGRNWQGQANSWESGDFNADGIVDAADLNEIGRNWQVSNSAAASSEIVPEPTAIVLVLVGIIAAPLLIRHKRRSKRLRRARGLR